MSWSGDRLVYWTSDPQDGRRHLERLRWNGAGEEARCRSLQTTADERNPQVSPDGKWIAYSSNETGRSEIYIRPFPEGPGQSGVGERRRVPALAPRWTGAVLHEPGRRSAR